MTPATFPPSRATALSPEARPALRPIVPAVAKPLQAAAPPAAAKVARDPIDWRGLAGQVAPPIAGLLLLLGVWALLTLKGGSFPTPWATFDAAVKLFSHPFYRNGPNDQGIGWNILFSLERVGVAKLIWMTIKRHPSFVNRQARKRSVWSFWSIWFVWFVWFVWLSG